jgi:subtilisin family serine protease
MKHKNRIFVVLVLFTLLLVLIQPAAAAQGFSDRDQAARVGFVDSSQDAFQDQLETVNGKAGQNQYIVLLQPTVKVSEKQVGIQRALTASGGRVKAFYSEAINGYSAELPPAALARLQSDPDVALIEPDLIMTVNDGWLVPSLDLYANSQSDPVWGLDRIDQRDLPLDQTFTYDTTAGDVHVYVLDTGLRSSHEEFSGRVGDGYSAIDDGRGTSDCNGHGTHVAGTIAGSTNGVAKGATIHPVRVMDCEGSGSLSQIIGGLDWILSHGLSPGVVNMSLGGTASFTLDLAVENVIGAGFTVVVAGGNSGSDACQVSPARVVDAITVGATDSSDNRPSFSNFGSCLDLFAPGVSITSAYYTGDSEYRIFSGTSMAAPHAAGAAALYLQLNPAATTETVSLFIKDSATSDVIDNSGTGSPNRLLFVNSGPIPLQPIGTVFQESNTFKWDKVEGATQYELELFEGASAEPIHTEQYEAAVCGATQCLAEPIVLLDLPEGSYQWWVRAYLDEQWGDWTVKVAFSVVVKNELFIPILFTD